MLGDAAGDVYDPGLEADAQAMLGGSYVLGGSSGPALESDSPDQRRRRVLEATMNRLQKEEQEIEDMCGSTKPA